ncbi:MAG: YifB family Mg chelatase-like AAA ATPase [Lachnospiraceae bacterium]
MFRTITSGALHGLDCYLTHVEVDTSQGLPVFELVGSVNGEVKEARERVRVALKNTGYRIPPVRITVNLSPANIRKEGAAFDLAIALGILSSLQMLPKNICEKKMVLGELGLDGQVRAVKGVLPSVLEARRNGYECCLIPYDNYGEGICVEGIRIYGCQSLEDAVAYVRAEESTQREWEKQRRQQWQESAAGEEPKESDVDFQDIRGQEGAIRAALIAAAGFHHLLMIGPPGAGKTMIAKRVPTILPPLTYEESLEVSKIYSIAGQLDVRRGLVRKRPMFQPHHTITEYAMAGGGSIPRPGVISLSHRGVLFLDELPEFRREVLEILRQPLEDKEIHIARTGGHYIYPASFLLLAAMNPCPCGYYPDRNRCRCTPGEIRRYQMKISGPIYDRIDLCVTLAGVDYEKILNGKRGVDSATLRKQVETARAIQAERYKGSDVTFNSDLHAEAVTQYCRMSPEAEAILRLAYETTGFSARSYHKILKVARTIADLEEAEKIEEAHIAEAIMYQNNEWQ